MNLTKTARIPADDGPQRAPDGEVDQGSFFFWLGDDGVEDEDEYGLLDDEANQ